jgi:hypothetical protein
MYVLLNEFELRKRKPFYIVLTPNLYLPCQQAISQEQHLLIPMEPEAEFDITSSTLSLSISDDQDYVSRVSKADIEDLLQSLPRNLHWDKYQQKESKQEDAPSQALSSLQILEEGEDEDDETDGELDIAWQYRKSVQRERMETVESSSTSSKVKPSNIFCHSYDLSGRLSEQSCSINPEDYMVSLQCCENQRHSQACGFHLFRELVSAIQEKQGKVVRLLLFHPNLDVLTVALPLLLAHIRQHRLPVVVLVCSTPTSATNKSWTRLQRSADVVLSTEGFASRREFPPPPEFRDLQGLLTILKLSTATAATANGGGHFGDLTISKRPAAYIYGFKRDRRKLHIPLLHIPPEDYAAGGGSTSGVRSGAGRVDTKKKTGGGMGCASNAGGSVLDF